MPGRGEEGLTTEGVFCCDGTVLYLHCDGSYRIVRVYQCSKNCMPNKVNFIICNLCLNKYDYNKINKDTKTSALKKKKLQNCKHSFHNKRKTNIVFFILQTQLLCIVRNKTLLSLKNHPSYFES